MQVLSASPYLSPEERKMLLRKNDWKAVGQIFLHWFWIAVAFAAAHLWPNAAVMIVVVFVLGGRQLACAILMHDASHRAVLKNARWNDWVGNWLGGYPVFQDMYAYRPYHHQHHITTGTEEDPDLLLTRGYPTSRKSMIRKFTRDLTGQTGVKLITGLILMHLGYLQYNTGGKVVKVSQAERSWVAFWAVFFRKLGGPILTNLILFGLLTLFAAPWLYLLWVVAYLTTFQLSLRVRSMAEHSMVDDPLDPVKNTRTTYANLLEKILFAPYNVNYHLEHHMLMAVPSYNLPKMHRLLKQRGFYEKGTLAQSYLTIIRMAVKKLA